MNYGFVIDNRRCIGCHACSTACKQENEVPLGVYRTWVKYVDKGAFPHSRRTFQVTRCNHCANPPCVRICPVTAMYQRTDGIVEFDPDVCIGCKACLQACPYDAIYIDPDSGTAAKCHYCSHRTDIGLEPACVVVCPTQAIVSGDLDDPGSHISRLVAREVVTVRKPEQGTAPKLFYIDGDEVALTPTAAGAAGTFMWADMVDERAGTYRSPGGSGVDGGRDAGRREAGVRAGDEGARGGSTPHPTAASGAPIRQPTEQGMGAWHGPIQVGEGRMAEHMVQVAYNAQHKVPWHWQVPAYLVTKAIGSGVFMVMTLLFAVGYPFPILFLQSFYRRLALSGTSVALVFIAITTVLLVLDLERPERFYTILTRPQWQSWLTRGAFILLGFSLVAGGWWLIEVGAAVDVVPETIATALRVPLLLVGGGLAALSAVYTAFLFGQAEGRDLWQSSLLPFHLLVQAMAAGAASFMLLLVLGTRWHWLAMGDDQELLGISIQTIFGASLLVSLIIILWGELGMPHATENAARAAQALRTGRFRMQFWIGGIVIGHLIPLILVPWALVPWWGGVSLDSSWLVAATTSLVGLYCYEYAYVMAPQEIPNA